MGAEDLIHCVLTSEAISKVTQYGFNLQTTTSLFEQVLLPDDKEGRNGIIGIDCIENPLKLVNISTLTKVKEIGSVASGQAISKARRSPLKSTTKFPKHNQGTHK